MSLYFEAVKMLENMNVDAEKREANTGILAFSSANLCYR